MNAYRLSSGSGHEGSVVIAESHSEAVDLFVTDQGNPQGEIIICQLSSVILSGNLVDKRELHLGEEL